VADTWRKMVVSWLILFGIIVGISGMPHTAIATGICPTCGPPAPPSPPSPAACAADLSNAIQVQNNGTSIDASFKPNDGALVLAQSDCNVGSFDWIQIVTALPGVLPGFLPNTPFYDGSAGVSSSPEFYYPPYADLTTFCANSVSGTCVTYVQVDDSVLNFHDSPEDPCLRGGSQYLFCTSSIGIPADGAIEFTTQLVGTDNGMIVDLPVSAGFTWQDTFNGSSGGVITFNEGNVDPSTGTGGITITSIFDVSEVPEPPSVYLFVASLIFTLMHRRHWRRRA
jgi:hypothetical protein